MRFRVIALTLCVLLAVVMVLGTISCAAGPPAPTGPIKWRSQNALSLTSYQYNYQFKPFVEMVAQRSNNMLTIELLAPGAVVDAYEQFSAVQKGVVDMSMGIGGYSVKQVPEGDIEQGVPGTFSSADDFFDWYMNYKGGQAYKILADAYKEKGIYLLRSPGPSDTSLIMKTAIKTIDDVKGKKVRASGANVEMVKQLGGAPVTLAPAEVFMALQTGTIDGVFFPTYTIGTMKLWDAAKQEVLGPFGQTSGNMFVSQKAFDALPNNLKDIVNKAAEDAAKNYVSEVKARTKAILDEATSKHGVNVFTLPAAEQAKARQAAAPILEKLSQATPRAKQLADLIKEYIASKK
ncbi:MAG: TRAP transporter substrate-binding protein DctP [Chloroflexota bacterium]